MKIDKAVSSDKIETPHQRRPFFRWLYAIGGALFGIGGGLNLPALSYRQAQSELTESPLPPEWSFEHLFQEQNPLALGIDRDERRLLLISRKAQVFNLETFECEAEGAPQPIENDEAPGLGPLAGRRIPLWGPLGRPSPARLLREARLVSNGLSNIVAVLTTADGRLLIVAQEDGIYVFRRLADA